jgi:hypothetical protein
MGARNGTQPRNGEKQGRKNRTRVENGGLVAGNLLVAIGMWALMLAQGGDWQEYLACGAIA